MINPAHLVVACGSILPAPVLNSQKKLSVSRSQTPCWTCRRRRIICDKALPTCQKCHLASRQCLGYKRPLVWNKGVASRGKMMGKTFEDVKKNKRHLIISNPPVLPDVLDEVTEFIYSPSISPLQSSFSIQGALVDPIFQDVKPLTRFYLDYYAHKLSAEAVLLDFPGQNPYRELMALIGTSPLLLKTILAVSARDFTNFNTNTAPPLGSSSFPLDPSDQLQSTSRYHALSYKQSALTQLRIDLDQSSELNHHVLFASISLLVFIEVLESGKDAWRVHLEGAQTLVQVEEATARDNELMSQKSSSSLRTNSFFFDACIIFHIMGSTLTRPYNISKPIPPTREVFNSIHRSEQTTFLGCPAELLYLILVVNWQYWAKMQTPKSNPSSPFTATQTAVLETDDASIIKSIESFCPTTWAQKTSLLSPRPDIPQRMHLSSAYKSAVLIYALRALRPATAADSILIPDLASSIIDDLATIPADDPFLKCILWPTFIAGAESEDQERRDAAKSLFHCFWLVFKSVNATNAVVVLEQIWKRVDEAKAAAGQEDGKENWCDYLANSGADWLFV